VRLSRFLDTWPRYGPRSVNPSPRTLLAIYYVAVGALIVVGLLLWGTGHGTGDPYLTVGVVLAVAPIIVNWVRNRFRRA
jgi:hypothetical protein